MLFFWAYSAFFMVECSMDTAMTKDSEGKKAGYITGFTSRAADGQQEFVVIGRSSGLKKVTALQSCWEDGIAYRTNIVRINEPAWIKANPVRKLIALM